MIKQRNKQISAYKEPWMQENGLNKTRNPEFKKTDLTKQGTLNAWKRTKHYKEPWLQENELNKTWNPECKKTD